MDEMISYLLYAKRYKRYNPKIVYFFCDSGIMFLSLTWLNHTHYLTGTHHSRSSRCSCFFQILEYLAFQRLSMSHTHILHLFTILSQWQNYSLRAKMHSLGSGVWQGGILLKKVRSILSCLTVLSLSPKDCYWSPNDLSFQRPN